MSSKYQIIAAAHVDGGGIVVDGDSIFLIRAPYTRSSRVACTEKEVGRFVLRGYEPCNICCNTFDEVVRTLKQMYIESKNIE